MRSKIQLMTSTTFALCCVALTPVQADSYNGGYAPQGYLGAPNNYYAPNAGYYNAPAAAPAPAYPQNYNAYGQGNYQQQPTQQYSAPQQYGNYGNNAPQQFYPNHQLPPGYNYSAPQQQYGYGQPQNGYGQPQYGNQYNARNNGYNYRQAPQQRRRPVNDEPLSLVPWDHFPGGGMPDFNPFSQGPTKGLPQNMFDTPMKDWAVDQFGDVWEDALNGPHNMGRLPGNFQAPSVNIPNPIDLGDQVGDATATASEEAPEVIQGWFD